MTEIADAVVVDYEPTTALVPQARRGEVLRPLDVTQQKEAMDLYQLGLREILAADDWQGRPGAKGSFVKKSGWRKIAAWFDLSVELVRDHVDRDDAGVVERASVWARASAPSGRFADGDGYCSATESRFTKDAGRQKLENDLRGTATTRAINRAISNLVGMGAVSAEEMDDADRQAPGPPYGPKYDEGIGKVAGEACVALAGGDPQAGIALWKAIAADLGGYMPQAAAVALIDAATSQNRDPGDFEAPDPT